MSETVLVTGGTGFVAGWCIVELLRRGYTVRATVRSLEKGDAVRVAVATQVDPGDRLDFYAADLMSDAGWEDAVAGCDYVLHVASPLGGVVDDPQSLIGPAREGALRVLAASVGAGVRRVVLTSSTAACAPRLQGPDSLGDETRWTDIDDPTLNAYRRSKVLAEKAAWDFMRAQGGETELTTVLPTAIFGPILSKATLGSVMVVGRILSGRMPGAPRLGFTVVDARDLAVAHVLAMTSPQAAGERFIAGNDYMWMGDIARELRARMGPRAGKVRMRTIPDFVMRILARFDSNMASVLPSLGRRHAYSSAKAQAVLGWRPRPGAETVVDCAESLLAHGVIKP